MLLRFVGSPRLYTWLLVTGVVVAVTPFPLTMLTRSKAAYHEAQVQHAEQQIEWLRSAVQGAISAADSAAIQAEMARVTEDAAVAQRRLDRQVRRLGTMWRVNGGGPLLLAVGLLIAFLGYRLRRFELYGE
ncbi:MAG: hypothetical protein IH616_17250 [Gemmatimonadales bacterium]|jgi:hypothetical protein|nr:hypothetical protein [Gemmatimonadales bacterium]